MALLVALGTPRADAEPPSPGAASPSGSPPWSVEAPGAAGAPFGLGLDALSERQGSLTIDSAQTIVTTRDLARGITLTQVLDGDPALLNRKFSIREKTTSYGAQLPLALPPLPLGAGLRITPTLVLQAASSDVELDFDDRPEPHASTSVHGRGLQLGAALDLVAPLCQGCSWYAGTGCRYRFVPRFGVDRGQPVAEPGARVAASDVRLGRTVAEGSLRVGHVFGGNRAALYLGILRRRARTTVDDDLTLVQDAIGQQTRLASRTRFGSTTTAAVAGLDVHVLGSVFVRTEVTLGNGDTNVLGKLVVVPSLRPWFPELQRRHPRDPEQERASQIAAAVAPGLAAIRDRFVKESQRLLAQQPAPAAAEVLRLLDDTQCDLLSTLHAPELAALRDFVKDLFAQAREALGLGPPAAPCARAGSGESSAPLAAGWPGEAPPARAQRVLPAVLSSRWLAHQLGAAAQQATVDRPAAKSWFDRISDVLSTMLRQATDDDERLLLCVESQPPNAQFALHYQSDPKNPVPYTKINTNHQLRAYRGKYFYTVKLGGNERIGPEEINLVMDSSPILKCVFPAAGDTAAPGCGRNSGVVETLCPQ